MEQFSGTRTEVEEICTIRDKVLGGPSRGVHVGRGPHVPMPDAWDRRGKVPLGWTGHDGPSDDGPSWTCELPKTRLLAANDSMLSASERLVLTTALARVVERAAAMARTEKE